MAIGCPRGLPFCHFSIHYFQTIQPPAIKMEHPEICGQVETKVRAKYQLPGSEGASPEAEWEAETPLEIEEEVWDAVRVDEMLTEA